MARTGRSFDRWKLLSGTTDRVCETRQLALMLPFRSRQEKCKAPSDLSGVAHHRIDPHRGTATVTARRLGARAGKRISIFTERRKAATERRAAFTLVGKAQVLYRDMGVPHTKGWKQSPRSSAAPAPLRRQQPRPRPGGRPCAATGRTCRSPAVRRVLHRGRE